MDDLNTRSWSSRPASLKPTPLPHRPSTASPGPSSSFTKPPAAANDSFASLVSFGRSKQTTGTLSLQEQQRRLQEQKEREEEERRRKIDALFGGGGTGGEGDVNKGFWDSLESGKAVGGGGDGEKEKEKLAVDEEEDDLLAAFSASVKVDNSSHYPPPAAQGSYTAANNNSSSSSAQLDLMGEPASPGLKSYTPAPRNGSSHLADLMGDSAQSLDLDPFGIGSLPSRTTPVPIDDDDDDILGDLAKPVSALPSRPVPTPAPPAPSPPPPPSDPRDPAIAEIVEMGFTPAQAKRALYETDSLDVQTAVGWLLEDAHKKSRPTSARPGASQQGQRGRRGEDGASDAPRRRREGGEAATPAWARDRSRDPNGGEKDLGALAQEIGGTLFKSANSLWNTGKMKVEKALAEYKAEEGGDPGMPKWMREQQQQGESTVPARRREKGGFDDEDMRPAQRKQVAAEAALTEEAMMLEAGGGPPPRRKQERERDAPRASSGTPAGLGLTEKEMMQRQRDAREHMMREKQQREQRERERERGRERPHSAIPNSSERNRKLTREAVEEDSAVQYVSRNRRRPPPSSASGSSKPATPEPPQGDLLFGGGAPPAQREQSRNPFLQPHHQPAPVPQRRPSPTPPAPRRATPQRPTIPISPSAQSSSTTSRTAGSDAFKRGDFTLALTHYTASLTPLPQSHTLRIISLSNRALCNLKLGDPKSALLDCEEALTIIGPSRGEAETITLEGTQKDMKEFWGKTITRKAEALEQLEKWADAGAAWTLAVEAGTGGAVAAAGRRRCDAALKPKAPAAAAAPRAPAPRPNAARRPPPPPKKPQTDAVAVKALRQANAQADRVEDEKLALHDSVEARIGTWKAGKEGNLRALLGSLDTVLWEGCGWKKVGMGELLLPGKCKIAYMKGISKVHPDKIAQNATTEQRMVSAAVFSLLNEAWDKFKAENGL